MNTTTRRALILRQPQSTTVEDEYVHFVAQNPSAWRTLVFSHDVGGSQSFEEVVFDEPAAVRSGLLGPGEWSEMLASLLDKHPEVEAWTWDVDFVVPPAAAPMFVDRAEEKLVELGDTSDARALLGLYAPAKSPRRAVCVVVCDRSFTDLSRCDDRLPTCSWSVDEDQRLERHTLNVGDRCSSGGHGDVSGVVIGSAAGVAPHCRLMYFQVGMSDLQPGKVPLREVVRTAVYVAEHRSDYGDMLVLHQPQAAYESTTSPLEPVERCRVRRLLSCLNQRLMNAGVLWVVAAGNYPSFDAYPACAGGLLPVTLIEYELGRWSKSPKTASFVGRTWAAPAFAVSLGSDSVGHSLSSGASNVAAGIIARVACEWDGAKLDSVGWLEAVVSLSGEVMAQTGDGRIDTLRVPRISVGQTNIQTGVSMSDHNASKPPPRARQNLWRGLYRKLVSDPNFQQDADRPAGDGKEPMHDSKAYILHSKVHAWANAEQMEKPALAADVKAYIKEIEAGLDVGDEELEALRLLLVDTSKLQLLSPYDRWGKPEQPASGSAAW